MRVIVRRFVYVCMHISLLQVTKTLYGYIKLAAA